MGFIMNYSEIEGIQSPPNVCKRDFNYEVTNNSVVNVNGKFNSLNINIVFLTLETHSSSCLNEHLSGVKE